MRTTISSFLALSFVFMVACSGSNEPADAVASLADLAQNQLEQEVVVDLINYQDNGMAGELAQPQDTEESKDSLQAEDSPIIPDSNDADVFQNPGDSTDIGDDLEVIELCGNGVCDDNESSSTCPEDCCVCGDGLCDNADCSEKALCPEDCAVCGDGICDASETELTCAPDCCGTCGDGLCLCDENSQICPGDCT
jgi:hypothetical protein